MADDATPLVATRTRASRWPWLVLPLVVALAGFWGYTSSTDQWAVTAVPPLGPVAPADDRTAFASADMGGPADSPATIKAKQKSRPEASRTAMPRTDQPVAGALAKTDSNLPARWPLWEFQLKQPVLPRNPPLTPPNWRLVGSSNDGKQWQLVILRQGKAEPEFYKVGQELPGKYKIEAITGEDVTLVQRGRRMVLSYIGY
jgi:hypothetical protein